jgi:hypothetical protein
MSPAEGFCLPFPFSLLKACRKLIDASISQSLKFDVIAEAMCRFNL